MLIQIVVLDLTEVPVIGIQNFQKHLRLAVIGKPNIADAALRLLTRNPRLDAQALKMLPLCVIREHMHEIVVNMVGAETGQLLTEGFVNGPGGADDILGELCSNKDPVTAFVFLQNPSQAFLAARVNISGIKIIDTLLDGKEDFLFRFFVVDGISFSGESHAAVSQLGNLIAVSVKSVIHIGPPLLSEGSCS